MGSHPVMVVSCKQQLVHVDKLVLVKKLVVGEEKLLLVKKHLNRKD